MEGAEVLPGKFLVALALMFMSVIGTLSAYSCGYQVKPAKPTLCIARASVETACPNAYHKEALKLAPERMTDGKLVAPGTTSLKVTPGPVLETP
nr:hypothetical protein Iba_chr06eCG1610 [Ipomoea batatas]